MPDKADLNIMRRQIADGRVAFDGSNGPLDLPVRVWIDAAEELTDELEQVRGERDNMRAALEAARGQRVIVNA